MSPASTPRLLRERTFDSAPDAQRERELRQARRALLASPWLTREDSPDDFRLVRRHREVLASWFAETLAYQLVVETDTARLRKAPLGFAPPRPLLRGANRRPMSPDGYALLICTLAALGRSRDQVLLGDLAREVRGVASDAGLDLDLEVLAHRRLLQSVLRQLLRMHVLHERQGSVEGWDLDRRVEALIDVRRDRLALLLDLRLAGVRAPEDLLAEQSLPSSAGGARTEIRRRLLESPVLDATSLSEDQAQWWRRNRARDAELIEDWLGLQVELRAEGALAIDPGGELSDLAFPGAGTVPHATLLVLDRLLPRLRTKALALTPGERGWVGFDVAALHAALTEVVAEHGRGFSREYRDDLPALAAAVLDLLRSFGLVRADGPDHWLLHAAAARYTAEAELLPAAPSLFDPEEVAR